MTYCPHCGLRLDYANQAHECQRASLKAARERRGRSLAVAAATLGITKAHLWEMETGRSNNPTAKTLGAIWDIYGISPNRMVMETGATLRMKPAGCKMSKANPAAYHGDIDGDFDY